MKIIYLFLLFTSVAIAAPYQRLFQDAKLPSQKIPEYQLIENPAAAGTADVLSGNAGNTGSGSASATTFVAQPDVPRNLVITPGSTTADVAECTVTVSGTNFHGDSITEDFAFAENASSATTGAKAFASVSSVSFPAGCEDSPYGATWSVGYGEKLGLKRCLSQAGHILFSTLNGAKEGTAPTIVADADEIEKNTADFNGAMNGSNDFELFFFQNFNDSAGNCFP